MQASKTLLYQARLASTRYASRRLTGLSLAKASATAMSRDSSMPKLFGTHQTIARTFHATSSASLPVKRRRRRGDTGEVSTNDDGESPTSLDEHSPVTDPIEFEEKGQAILEKLGKAIEPMIPINDPFEVSRTSHMLKITLDKAMGSYEVEMDPDERVVVLRSPISGAHSYFFSKKTEQWVDTVDFHSLEGIFVRDLIRHCQGVPKL